MRQEIFLDTSIILSRLKGRRFRSKIKEHLADFRFRGASSYSKSEYGNVVLSVATLLLNKIDHLGSLTDAREWFANCVPPQRRGWQTWGFNLLREYFGKDERELTERARLGLQSFLRVGTRAVDRLVDYVADGTKCVWAQRKAEKTKHGLRLPAPRCSRKAPRCRVAKFFKEHRQLFEAIRERIGRIPDEEKTDQLRGFERTIDGAIENPNILFDYKNCKRLADALIAVDSEPFRSFFTQNVKESRFLCEVLKQHLYYLPSNFEKPIEQFDFAQGNETPS